MTTPRRQFQLDNRMRDSQTKDMLSAATFLGIKPPTNVVDGTCYFR